MVRKILVGFLWFLAFEFLVGLLIGLVVGLFSGIFGLPAPHGTMREIIRILSHSLSLLFAVWGTITEKLPGTKKRLK